MTVKYLAIKKLPFNHFDDDISREFFASYNPNIPVPQRKKMQAMTHRQYDIKKERVKKIIQENSAKLSFTVDGWTSFNGRSYYGVTAHLIRDDWKIYSFALDFIPSRGEHSGKDMAEMFFKCLEEYGIQEKVQGITMDNASANTTFMSELKILMDNAGFCFDNINQHFRCFAHIMNLGVQDINKLMKCKTDGNDDDECLEDILFFTQPAEQKDSSENGNSDGNKQNLDDKDELDISDELSPSIAIQKLRKTFVKVRRSEQIQNSLKDSCNLAAIKYIKPILDVCTRWNTTHDMIGVGLRLKKDLNLLWASKPSDWQDFSLNEEQWSLLTNIHGYLKHFKDISTVLGGQKYVTLPLVVVAFNMLLDKIENIIKFLDEKDNRTGVDEILIFALQAARDKMLKHYHKTNWVYCIALILDPRHKIETFEATSWGRELKAASLTHFNRVFQEYCDSSDTETNPPPVIDAANESLSEDDTIDITSIYEDTPKQKDSNTELNDYLALRRAGKDQDILQWWKDHEKSFPTLARMARDLLSIMATSVPSERLFSLARLIVTELRCSMSDESISALLCLNSWASSKILDTINE